MTAPPAVGVLGANVNQNLDAIDVAELRAVSATWVRGFYPMQDADQGDVADQPGMARVLAAAGQGYGTVLTMKFDYPQGLPSPGSPGMRVASTRLGKVLAAVMGKVDILVVGNEPWYECGGRDHTGNLNAFYEALAQDTITYRQRYAGAGARTQVYMGALTGIDDPAARTALTSRWMRFVHDNPSIAGTDCHPHVASLADGRSYADYIVPRLRPDQKYLATEFSLVKLFQRHLSDPVSTAFADRYRIPRGTPVWQVIRGFAAHPVPQRQWSEFLASCPWFADNTDFMAQMVGVFRAGGRCAVAAYGLMIDQPAARNVSPASPPWVLNSLFCPYLVQNGADGLPGRNLAWSNAFRALQHG